ncbi:homeobox protein Hox-D11a-like [Montipora foliosa]|uniref:homeobox protein Hox-D11a-like n=1 Tax=Montipora foliosa TaxID=591990 RepID=UPI0035F202E1
MDCSQYTGESMVSLVECLVRSAHAKKSRGRDAVSRKQFTDFSIRSILGLANDVTADAFSSSGCHSTTSLPLSPYSDCSSPPTSHRTTSPELTPHPDISSSGSVCDSETYRMPNDTEQAPRKKRQRTTFSRGEVMQLEQVFSQRQYLTLSDEKMLAKRIGITDKNVMLWFQNRRAKSRKLTREVSRVYQTTPPNRFDPLPTRSRLALPRRPQFVADQSGSDHWKHATCVSYRYGPVTQRKDQQYSRLSTPVRHQPSVQLNQFSRDVPCPFAMSNSGQSKVTHAQLARLTRRSSRSSRGFHPY